VAERAPAKLVEIAGEVAEGADPDDAEIRHMGTTYPVIGGHLLSLWGMGYNIVEAITCQREEWPGPPRDYQLGDVVQVAHHLVGSVDMDEGYLERVGLLANVRLYNQGFLKLR
jgi:hypothetical protein